VIFFDDNGKFRVATVFQVDPGTSDSLPCTAKEWRDESQSFETTADSETVCARGLRATDIMDYVASAPTREVEF
jgi:hypothetical protein